MTIQLSAVDGATRLTVSYTVAGYVPAGMNTWAAPVDEVLTGFNRAIYPFKELRRARRSGTEGQSVLETLNSIRATPGPDFWDRDIHPRLPTRKMSLVAGKGFASDVGLYSVDRSRDLVRPKIHLFSNLSDCIPPELRGSCKPRRFGQADESLQKGTGTNGTTQYCQWRRMRPFDLAPANRTLVTFWKLFSVNAVRPDYAHPLLPVIFFVFFRPCVRSNAWAANRHNGSARLRAESGPSRARR
jgi:hypothetical protein